MKILLLVYFYYVYNAVLNFEFIFNHHKYFTDTEITKIKMVSDVPSTFRILPGLFDPSLFHIDSSGRLTLSGSLDREKKDSHLIGILAETQGSPSISTLTEVTLNILDENDNSPEFHSNPYIVTLAENIEQGTSILKGLQMFIYFSCFVNNIIHVHYFSFKF